jgi:long-chain acyl-CoA synthetase
MVELAKPDDLAILVYTSGTTGPPKGAMLSHRNILFQLGYADFLAEPREGDQQLSFLPLSHIAERTFTVFYPLRTGATVNFAESIDTVPENLREVAPAMFFAVPRIWEKFYAGVALRMREATWIGRAAYRWALGVGMRVAEARIAGRPPSAGLRLLYRVADFLVLDNVKRSLGLHRARGAATGAAPIAPDLIKWYMALGVDMREVYGQTENCGLATAMPAHRIKLGTVGVARPGTEIRMSAAGEILLKGPHVFLGYYRSPAKTAETVVDGWLHTGDVATIDEDGFVSIVDRIKDLINRGGENVYSIEVENALALHPAVAEVSVVGVPDEMMGEKVGAVVVPREGMEIDTAELLDFTAERLADFKLPQYLVVRKDPLPRNPGGKIIKHEIRSGTEWGDELPRRRKAKTAG